MADSHSSRETLTISGTGVTNSKDVTSSTIINSNGTLLLAMARMGVKLQTIQLFYHLEITPTQLQLNQLI